MRVVRKITLAAVVAAAALTATAVAQPPGRGGFGGGGGGPAALLRSKTVMSDIKATDEQKEKLAAWGKEYAGKMRETMMEKMKDVPQDERREKVPAIMAEMAKETYKEIATVLDEKQVKRLKEIEVQVGGLGALTTPDAAMKLKVTDEQKEKLTAITTDMGKEMRELGEKYDLQRGQPRPADAGKAKEYDAEAAKVTKGAFDKALALMSDDQKSMYKDMAGEPIDVAKVRAETQGGMGKGKKKKDD